MNSNEPVRFRLTFSKAGDLRFVGHLDLQRLIERCLRRSGLPLRYSQGFNPKVRLNLASALPLGQESTAEVLDIWLDDHVAIPEVLSRLNQASPLGLRFHKARVVPNKMPSLQDSLRESTFSIDFLNTPDPQAKLTALLADPNLIIERRGKSLDIKPCILNLEWISPSLARMQLSAIPGATGRVDEILLLVGINPATVSITRVGMSFEGDVQNE